jgi:hypothetical protein
LLALLFFSQKNISRCSQSCLNRKPFFALQTIKQTSFTMAKKSVPPLDNSNKVKVAKKSSSPSKPKRATGGSGKTAVDRILEATATQHALGLASADRKRVQGLAAMTNKRSFDTILLTMRKKDLVTYDKNTVTLTKKGIDTVGPEAAAVPQNNDAMQDKLKEQLKQKKSREIFDILTDGGAYSRSELADKLGIEDNKSFGTYMSALSKLVDREGGKIRLQDLAFPCGRPNDA